VPNMKYLLLAVGSIPSHREANTRMKCPLVKSKTFPEIFHTLRTTRSARALTCLSVSPPGQFCKQFTLVNYTMSDSMDVSQRAYFRDSRCL
jgi:hypothetical protein